MNSSDLTCPTLLQGTMECDCRVNHVKLVPVCVRIAVFIPINVAAFILFKSVVGGGVYWRAAFNYS